MGGLLQKIHIFAIQLHGLTPVEHRLELNNDMPMNMLQAR
jgi:hypothetical protein